MCSLVNGNYFCNYLLIAIMCSISTRLFMQKPMDPDISSYFNQFVILIYYTNSIVNIIADNIIYKIANIIRINQFLSMLIYYYYPYIY
jgi:hypothetical protein